MGRTPLKERYEAGCAIDDCCFVPDFRCGPFQVRGWIVPAINSAADDHHSFNAQRHIGNAIAKRSRPAAAFRSPECVRLLEEDMKKNLRVAITSITLLAALTILVRLAAQEPQNESATTVTANPVPLINQPLNPDAIKPGVAGFTLIVKGTGFVSGSVVKWNGSARATTFVSASRLAAS